MPKFLTILQSHVSNTPMQSKWMFEKCRLQVGFNNITPRILIIGDNGTQTIDILSVFPSYTSINVIEHNTEMRTKAQVTLEGNQNITITSPVTSTLIPRSYDLIVCNFVLCRHPERSLGPVHYSYFHNNVTDLFEALDVNGLLLTTGSNYSITDLILPNSTLHKFGDYVSHVALYESDGVTRKSNMDGNYVLQRIQTQLPPPVTYSGFFNATITGNSTQEGLLLSGTSSDMITGFISALNLSNNVNQTAVKLSYNNGNEHVTIPIGSTYSTVVASTSCQISCNRDTLIMFPSLFLNIANSTTVVLHYI